MEFTTEHPKSEIAVKQLDKRQDFALCGIGNDIITEEPYTYGLILDGHGSNNRQGKNDFMEIMERCHLPAYISSENPVQGLWEYIKVHQHLYNINSGSTLVLAKVYSNRICIWNIGDSQGVVLINDQIVHITKSHDRDLESEFERVDQLGATSSPGNYPKVKSPTEIIMEKNSMNKFAGFCLVPTASLGHHGKTGLPAISDMYCEIPYSSSDTIKIILASDGLWDMFNMEFDLHHLQSKSAQELCDFAEARWKQEWTYNDEKTSFPGYDDISVCVIGM
jgi:serine/threonine protein phosphatase PrpC